MKTPDEMLGFSADVMERRIHEALAEIEKEYGGRVHAAAFLIYITPEGENSGMQAMETFGDNPGGWFDVAQAACHEALTSTAQRIRPLPREKT